MQPIVTALELNIVQKKLKTYKPQKYHKNIYRIQANNSIMCGYFYVGLIDFMLKGKSLLHYTNLFFPKEYEKNDKIIQKYFQYLKIKTLFYE